MSDLTFHASRTAFHKPCFKTRHWPLLQHLFPMQIHFFGAARTTTGSMYLLEVNGKRLLLECGLFQGHREESINRNCCFPFDPKQADAVVLSHAHMDHAGNLPNLVKQGYAGNIHCTFARSEEHTSELQSLRHLVCRLLLE